MKILAIAILASAIPMLAQTPAPKPAPRLLRRLLQ